MNNYSKVPMHMHGGIRRYVEQRIKPGGFLMALLENNFTEVVGLADQSNFCYLAQWAELLRWELPPNCHGSPGKVKKWLGGEG